MKAEYLNSRVACSVAGALLLVSVTACTTVLDSDKVDYKSTELAKKGPTLDVPPDLTQLRGDGRYQVPDRGTATLSDYAQGRAGAPVVATSTTVMPQPQGVRMERAGNQRWLVTNVTPEVLWPSLREFWQEQGFILNIDSPQTGIMETDWAENRAKIPQDFIRNTIGKVFDGLYATGERDKFRLRLERNAQGQTEIYISHRGAREELTGGQKDSTTWVTRPADPELEAEFLSRLMQRLGLKKEEAQTRLASVKSAETTAVSAPSRVILQGANAPRLDLPMQFDLAWRQVGLALDRVNFTVEDRDRSKGLYFVRYVDTKEVNETKGFFANLFGSKSKEDRMQAKRYLVNVRGQGDKTTVLVLNENNTPETGDVAKTILSLLDEQLR